MKSKTILIVAAIVLVIIVVLVIWYLNKNKQAGQETVTTQQTNTKTGLSGLVSGFNLGGITLG